ncbi:MAG: ATP-binding cassette domain-containing protein [Flavobacteriales bacterium]
MNCLSVERVSKRYGPRQLFKDISFGLEKGQKTAIVARNSTGKSTLLKCIAGLETPDEGMRHLQQRPAHRLSGPERADDRHTGLVDEMLDQDDPVTNAVREYEQHAIGRHVDEATMQRRADGRADAWDHEARVKTLLFRFGLRDLEQPVNTLSGGQQKRLAMAKVSSTPPMC